jgi:serine/threonine protein kinase
MTDLSAVYRLEQFIDTFALGHYARVLNAYDLRNPGAAPVAFKVLRPEHLSSDGDIRWEYRAFANEAALLARLSGSPQVVGLLDCGYVAGMGEAPANGEIDSFGTNVPAFVQAMPDFAERGWRPYLALENLPRGLNLLYLMRPDKPDQRWRLPSEEGLALALQFGEMLHMAHRMGIVYMDHKLEHVYWDGQRLQVIDFNSSRQIEGEPGMLAQQIRMDIHNLCVGVLYPVFTGLAPQKMALRPQPGTIEEAEGRYREITELDFGIEPTLSAEIKALLQAGAAQQIENADEFLHGLRRVAAGHGWDFMDYTAAPASREARARLRAGLVRLRQGQSHLREAGDLFREALVEEGISEDVEAELRRLVHLLNHMLNARVIP